MLQHQRSSVLAKSAGRDGWQNVIKKVALKYFWGWEVLTIEVRHMELLMNAIPFWQWILACGRHGKQSACTVRMQCGLGPCSCSSVGVGTRNANFIKLPFCSSCLSSSMILIALLNSLPQVLLALLLWYCTSFQRIFTKTRCVVCLNCTGTMGLKGNLTAGEIVEQLVHANAISKIRNIVFMVSRSRLQSS